MPTGFRRANLTAKQQPCFTSGVGSTVEQGLGRVIGVEGEPELGGEEAAERAFEALQERLRREPLPGQRHPGVEPAVEHVTHRVGDRAEVGGVRGEVRFEAGFHGHEVDDGLPFRWMARRARLIQDLLSLSQIEMREHDHPDHQET